MALTGMSMEDLKQKAREAADVAVKVAGDVVDSSKEKLAEARLNVSIKDAQARLGAAVYESRKTGKENEELCSLIVEELESLLHQKEEMKNAVRNNTKSELVCPRCGASLSRESAYCSRCGFFMKSGANEGPSEK